MRNALVLLTVLLAVPAYAQQPGWIGVSIEEGKEQGVLVESVDSGSPAAKAGIQKGDLIVEFNKTPLIGVLQFTRLVRETPVGRTVEIKVRRDNRTQTFQVTTDERPRREPLVTERDIRIRIPDMEELEERIASSVPRVHVMTTFPQVGLQADELTPQLREFFGVQGGAGILVASVDAGSAAEKAGLKAGDVIIAVGGKSVGSRSEFRRLIRAAENKATIKVLRNKKEQELSIDLSREQ